MRNENAAQRRKEKRKNNPPGASEEQFIMAGEDRDYEHCNLDKKVKKNTRMFLKLGFPSASVWTAIFTAILTLFTYLEYRVSRVTSDIQKSSERAYLTFVGPLLGARLISGSVLTSTAPWTGQEFSLNWGNNGETPARDVVVQVGANAFYPDIPKEYDFPLNTDKTHIVVGPKSTYGTNIQIPTDVIMDGWNSKKRIFVWGNAVYHDVFDGPKDRLTEFCVEVTHLTMNPMPSSTPPPNSAGDQGKPPELTQTPVPPTPVNQNQLGLFNFQWQQCRAHNCYDEDCVDYESRIKDMRTQ